VSSHNGYPAATPADLAETGKLLADIGSPHALEIIDVRDAESMTALLARVVPEFGNRLDVVVANAGIVNWNRFWEMPEDQWQSMVDVNLTGVWKTMRAAVPHMLDAGNGGSIIAVSSVAGIKSLPAQAHYSAAKHGVVGLVKTAAIELGEYGIRVNTIHPWGVNTSMIQDTRMQEVLAAHPNYLVSFGSMLPQLPIAELDDISDAVIWLASDLSRTVTGAQIPVDMGATKV
jgi:NAD(P)-dependent dehydrogenase (short-subunit alcohol dehydrogenase family)